MKNSNGIIAGLMALMFVFGAGTAVIGTKISVPEENVIATSAETLKYESLSYKVEDNDTITITGFDDSVTEVEIPAEIDGKKVMTIRQYAFQNKKLTNVTIPDSVTSIGYQAFYGCKNLTALSMPDSIIELSNECFYDCTSLQSVKFSNKLTEIKGFYGCTSLEEITIPASVRTVAGFGGCTSLTSVTIPSTVNTIGSSAFSSCKGLKSVTIEEGVQFISNNYAFSGCSALESVTIPESVVSIGGSAFANCTALKEITILNPSCSIDTSSSTVSNGFNGYTGVIYGAEDSTAQAYAEKNNYTFQSISSKPRKGDMNNDGNVDAVDGSIILSYYAYLSTLTEGETSMDIDAFQASGQ
ncbi:MAG: leucine-rich repeat protein [Ruminococcus sp.]|nr:leucine-rich repeat protein [Ruminococcus sp.]